MWKPLSLTGLAAILLGLTAGCGGKPDELLNVSYDPTRELYKDINEQFIKHHERETGIKVSINVSHGGSGSQARSVVDGLKADVVTLALPSDTDLIRKKGLIADDW